MNVKYPPSILVAIYTSFGLCAIYLGTVLISSGPRESMVMETLAFFTISLILITAILEFYLYRRLKNLDEVNKQEIQKLKEMEAFRREFIGDVSHELKTPIFAIEGFIETLLEGAMDDDKVNRKFLQKTQKHAGRLSSLVQDILVITQLESGQLTMRPEKFGILTLVQEVHDSLAYKLTKKGRDIKFHIQAEGLEEVEVFADKERIEQVLRNLIDNAVKYGDSQGNIQIQLEEMEDNKVRVGVTDDGQGIAPEHLPRIFERFYRVDKSRSRERGGTGLGLAICKHMMEAHNEKIKVNSELGKGTTFWFTLQKV